METIHIIDNRSRTRLLDNLLTNNESIINQRFIDFDRVFYETFNQTERKLNTLKTVQDNINMFTLLKGTLAHKQSVFEALNFLDLLDRYQIDLKQLPTDTPINTEKTNLINLLVESIQRPYQQFKEVNEAIVIHPFYQELYHQKYISQAEIKQKSPVIIYKSALNMRQEVSGLSHYLSQHKEKQALILVGSPSYIPILKQQIPSAQFLNDTKIEPLFLAYYYLMKAFLAQDKEALISFFTLNIKQDSEMKNFLKVVNDYEPTFDELIHGLIEKNFQVNEVIKQNVNDEKSRYQSARSFSLLLASRFKEIDQTNLYTSLFDFISSSNHASLQLKQILEQNYVLTKKHHILDVLELTLLNPVTVSTTESNIVVADYTYQPSTQFETIIYLGLSSNNYPNAKKMTGLYNESYVEKISDFPSLSERLTFHIKQLSHNFTISETLILSYPQMDYQGKPQYVAFEIEQLVKDVPLSNWEFSESQGHTSIIQNLNPELARKLFLQDDYLIGSVSRLEKYTTNSYQYFIEHGLNITSKSKLELDAAVIGTLSHYVMEVLVSLKNKDYTNATLNEIKEILSPTFNQLKELFPQKNEYFNLSLNRLSTNIYQSIQSFKEYENKYPTEIFSQEYRFNKEQLFDSVKVLMNGIVDRIDLLDEKFIVIDYKSSDHSIKVNEVLNGRQLQLPTYSLLLQKELNKPLLAMAYFMLNLGLVSTSTFKLNASNFELGLQNVNTNNTRLKFFESTPYETRKISSNNLFDQDKLEAYFEKLYQHLYTLIANGTLNQFIEANQYFDFNDTQRNIESFGEIEELHSFIDPLATLDQREPK